MRTTIAIDDELFAKAQEYAWRYRKICRRARSLEGVREREAARRLARLGGSDPEAKAPPRRRF